MKGSFRKEDVAQIKQSVRHDGHWKFFERQILLAHTTFKRKLHIAEVGAGTGDNVLLAHKRIPTLFSKFYCIDDSKEMLNFILKEKHLKNVVLIKANLEKDFPKIPQADIFIAKFFFHHIKNKEALLKEMYERIPENGKIIIIDKFPSLSFLTPFIENVWSLLKIKKVLGKHYYTKSNKFIFISKKIGFQVETETYKKLRKATNFFVKKGFIVLKKEKKEK